MTCRSFEEWATESEKVAYALGLKPREFDDLQPSELLKMVDGYRERTRREDERRAYFTSWAIAPMTMKPPSPIDIVRPLYPAETAAEEKARREADEAALRRDFGME